MDFNGLPFTMKEFSPTLFIDVTRLFIPKSIERKLPELTFTF